MPKYLVERDMPGVGKSKHEDLRTGSLKSCDALRRLGGEVHWQQSYVTDDKIYCVYVAPTEEKVRQHAELSGFPVTHISEVYATIDPSSAEAIPVRKAA